MQKKRRLNDPIGKKLAQGNTQRQIARVLGVARSTVERKLRFLAAEARLSHQEFLKQIQSSGARLETVHFDEMETFERSKCLPVSIPLVVDPKTRKILGIGACSMPAKGPLTSISLRKYGPRRDDRQECAQRVWTELAGILSPRVLVVSDQNPKYPGWIQAVLPEARQETHKGRRGRNVGQGELKVGGYDPLFPLNHTCAMIRAHVSRLFRRTWNTTKKIERLEDHLYIYLKYHNQVLT